ncbi:MAG: hypothetical protein K5905_10735 [Roseibium sp.]|uniref:hypothetical protein n=1 Tax=Roseibium sp. TaxID=1936156 RepID=UPI002631F1AA|nr:hypothetical protein [Roseibium sp.]MCV0425940.1 hypothetical protein [Roseibium sp.]
MSAQKAKPGLPLLWNARRVFICAALVANGIVQSLGAIALSLSSAALLKGDQAIYGIPVFAALAFSALAALALFVAQTRYAEHFALSYVHDVRMAYARHVLLLPIDGKSPGVGLSLTRLVNDLGAIKLWLSKGLLALVTLVPTLGTVAVWSIWQETAFLLPLFGSFCLWGVGVLLVAKPLRVSIRQARQKRGSIALLLGRVLPDRLPLLLHGRFQPVLNKLAQKSDDVRKSLITRATLSSVLRALSRVTFPVAVVIYGLVADTDDLKIALFLLIFAFVVTQLEAGAAGIEYLEASRVAREKLSAVFKLSVMSPLVQQKLPDLSWQHPIEIDDLPLPSGKLLNAQIPARQSTNIVGENPQDLRCISLSLCGLAQDDLLRRISMGKISFSDLGRKEIWRRTALVSPVNGIPHHHMRRPAVELGRKHAAHTELFVEFERIFGVQPNWAPDIATIQSEMDRLLVRIARAFLRSPRFMVIHDDFLVQDTNLRLGVQELANNEKITLVFLSEQPVL